MPYLPGRCKPKNLKRSKERNAMKFLKRASLKAEKCLGKILLLSDIGMYWSKLKIDENLDYIFYYIATNRRSILRIVSTKQHKIKFIVQLPVFDPSIQFEFFKTLTLVGNSLFFTTDFHVGRINLEEVCNSFTSCTSCISDPMCSWHPKLNECYQSQQKTRDVPPLLYCSNGMIHNNIINKHSLESIHNLIISNYCIKERDRLRLMKKAIRGTNRNVLLTCSSFCNTTGDVNWFLGNQQVNMNDNKFSMDKNSSLIIWDISSMEQGLYSCTTGDNNVVIAVWEVLVSGL